MVWAGIRMVYSREYLYMMITLRYCHHQEQVWHLCWNSVRVFFREHMTFCSRHKNMKLVIGMQIVNIVTVDAPQVRLGDEEKDDFWDSFIIVLSGIPEQESIFIW